jgi:Na+/H+-dicarboxylate symporter
MLANWAFLQHPLFLVVCGVLGGLLGYAWPAAGPVMEALASVYVVLLQMSALPLIMVAVIFGLRQMMNLPNASLRISAALIGGVLTVLFASTMGTFGAAAVMKQDIVSEGNRIALGQLNSHSQAPLEMALRNPQEEPAGRDFMKELLPANYFKALASGAIPAILLGALVFGLAFSQQRSTQAKTFFGTLEMIYRSLEVLIDRINSLLPLAVLAFAGGLASSNDFALIRSISSFLMPFLAGTLGLTGLTLLLLAKQSGQSMGSVVAAMLKPMTICLFSPIPTAAVPSFIDAMSAKLGFTRAIVELITPLAPYFLRSGEALFFGMLGVFIARFYGHDLPALELAQIALLSALAAFVSIGTLGVASVMVSAVMLVTLDLPLDGVLPALVAIEVICSGARNLISSVLACGLIGLISSGLKREYTEVKTTVIDGVFRASADRRLMWAALGLTTLALLLTFLIGVSVGLRR